MSRWNCVVEKNLIHLIRSQSSLRDMLDISARLIVPNDAGVYCAGPRGS
jgi:hypothetical protein